MLEQFDTIVKRITESLPAVSDQSTAPPRGPQEVFIVHVPANVYAGKYYEAKTVRIYVPVADVQTPEGAMAWVNNNKQQVLQQIAKKKTQGGRNYVARPVEKNVFFRDKYYTPKITINQT